MKGYIYVIRNKLNDKLYVGRRFGNPEEDKNYFGSGSFLKQSVVLDDKENYERITLFSDIQDEEELSSLEYQMINELNTQFPNGYNLNEGGFTNGIKISKSNKGRVNSDISKENIRKGTIEGMVKMKNKERLKSRLGAHWYTNGIESKCLFECPEGWLRGKTVRQENHNMRTYIKCECGKEVISVQMKRHLESDHSKWFKKN